MHRFLIIIGFIGLSLNAMAQKPLPWEVLGLTTYTNDEMSGDGRLIPNFPTVLEKNYANREVIISGYMIPMDVEANTYALSKNPFSSCFFCGNAGPETVIELRFTENPGRFVTDQYLMIKGTLKLNKDGYGLFYTLLNAELHG